MPATKRKTIPKKTAAKKTIAKSSAKKVTSSGHYRTLRPAKSARPFLSSALTEQTFYWLLIAVLILGLGGWIIHLQVKINGIYDTIDENEAYYSELEEQVIHNREAIKQNAQKIEAN